MTWIVGLVLLTAPDFGGDWIHSFGRMTLEQEGNNVTGSYGAGFTIEGTVEKNKLTFTYREGGVQGEGEFDLARDGRSFRGEWRIAAQNRSGTWLAWKQDPDATNGKPAKFDGYWYSNQGTFDLKQKRDKVTGTYGCTGWVKVEGTVKGRVLEFTWAAPWGTGTGRLEQSKDGKTIFGLGKRASRPNEWLWNGRRVDRKIKAKAKPKPGKIVPGISANRVTYHLRAPKGWKKSKPVDVIVVMHGSNMCSNAYVNTIAKAWPRLGERYFIIGIDGDKWAQWSKPGDDRFNYHYMNWMGRSTFKGYPNTERDSPWAIAETIKELQQQIKMDRVFIGGHSQGGLCTWAMCMHYPEMFAGAFPVSGALLMQSAPGVFDDADLKKAQRALPIALVHGKTDPAVGFGASESAYKEFVEHGFPFVRLFDHATAGHMFGLLPVDRAIDWLDAMSSGDAEKLKPYVESKDPRIATTALLRSKDAKYAEVSARFEKQAAEGATKYLPLIEKNADSSWADGFYLWRDQYEFTDAAKPVMKAFYALRAEQEEAATKLVNEGRQATNQRRSDDGWAKYEEVVEKYPASSQYRKVKGWLKGRK